MDEENKQLSIENSGDHHFAKVSVDEKTKEVSAGVIYSFSDNASASLQVINGKLEGTILHTGDTHILKIDVGPDGSYNGTYKDERYGGIEIAFNGGVASLVKGKLPQSGIVFNADHHNIKFDMEPNGQISGTIGSMNSKFGNFQLSISNGKLSGSIIHKGDNHETSLEVASDGSCKASVSIGKDNSKFTFSAEKGKTETKAFAGLKLNF